MWSDAARKAAAAKRRASGTMKRSRGGRTLRRSNNAERAQGVRFGAEAHTRVGSTGKVSKPHKVLGQQSSSVATPRASLTKKPQHQPPAHHGPTDMHTGQPKRSDYSKLPAHLKVPWLDAHGKPKKYKKGK